MRFFVKLLAGLLIAGVNLIAALHLLRRMYAGIGKRYILISEDLECAR